MSGVGREEFGVWLRDRRVERGLTQAELSAVMGRSGSWLGQVEAGRTVAVDRGMGAMLDTALGLERDTVFERLVRLTAPEAAALFDERLADLRAGARVPATVAKVVAIIEEVGSMTDDGAALVGLVRLVEVGRSRDPIGEVGISPGEALTRLLVHLAGMERGARERVVVSAFYAASAAVGENLRQQ